MTDTNNVSIFDSRDCTHLFRGYETLKQECKELGISFSRVQTQFDEDRITRQRCQHEKEMRDEQYEFAMFDLIELSPTELATINEAERLAVLDEVWKAEFSALEE